MIDSFDTSDSAQRTLFAFIFYLVLVCVATNFGFLNHQIKGLAGSKGVYSAKQRMFVWEKSFPLAIRLLRSPMYWYHHVSTTVLGAAAGGWTNAALTNLTVGGAGLALFLIPFHMGVFLTTASTSGLGCFLFGASMWGLWAAHLMLTDICLMVFPWHSMMSETLFIFAMTFTPSMFLAGGASGSPLVFGGSAIPAFSLRLLVFRVLVGFGKIKFAGATKDDFLYIKPFIPAIPVPSKLGLIVFRTVPTAFYYVGYGFFFLSEIIIPFFFFSWDVNHRFVAAMASVGLMMGITATGNFGNFNILTSILALAAILPVTTTAAVSTSEESTLYTVILLLCKTALIAHSVGGTMLILFNSWVQQAWFSFTSFRVAVKWLSTLCQVFELACEWRILHPYGIFPPNIFSPQRQIYVYEGSNDGQKWDPIRYKYQPIEARDAPATIPGLHPWLDFNMFYQVGYWGGLRSSFNQAEPIWNWHCRPVDAVTRNLLQGGDVYDLLAPHAQFKKTSPAKYIRVVQHQLLPIADHSSPDYWKVIRGQVEIPATSAETLYRLPCATIRTETDAGFSSKPPGIVSTVGGTLETANRTWRQRVGGAVNADQWDRSEAAVTFRLKQVVATLKKKFVDDTKESGKPLPNDFWDKTERDPGGNLQYKIEDGHLSPAAMKIIQSVSSNSIATLKDAVKASDSRRKNEHEYRLDEAACREIHHAANEVADVLVGCGYPFSGEHIAPDGTKIDRVPTNSFQTYLFVLWLLCDPKERLGLSIKELKEKVLELSSPDGRFRVCHATKKNPEDVNEAEVHQGVLLYATLFARTVRLEASIFRRMFAAGMFLESRMEDKGADAIVPGYNMYWRSVFQRGCPFEWSDEGGEGQFGEETRFHFEFDKSQGMWVFQA